MGAWIETTTYAAKIHTHSVAPYVGAWIETFLWQNLEPQPSVAPYVGAWIETLKHSIQMSRQMRRTLRGCVD